MTRSTRARAEHPGRRRAAAALAAALLASLTGACSSFDGTSSEGAAEPAQARSAPVRLETNVADGSTVPVDTRVVVTATGGNVADASLTYQDPESGTTTAVTGTVAPDGSTWTAGDLLEPGTDYTLTVNGTGGGATAALQRSFRSTALTKKQEILPKLAADGATVGVAMPVVVTFDVPVADRAAFQRHMSVTSEPAQPGAWSWFSDTEVHYRPKDYWQPGTKVSVDLDLNGVPAGNGTYGQMSMTGGFTVGQSVLMQADLQSKQMTVTVDGAVVRTIPVTAGKRGWETRSGHKVIMEKFSSLKMDASTLGVSRGSADYYSLNVRYAMRETWSGEFVHAAPWSVGSQGRANVSHGCIGMSTANAAWLFGVAKVGDPLVVTGTNRGMERGNGYTDWNESFEEYQAGSALPA